MLVSIVDFNKIMPLVNSIESTYSSRSESIQLVKKKLLSAQIVQPHELPSNIVTMNSVVTLRQINPILTYSIKLVYPTFDNVRENRVSLFSALGVAIFLGKIGEELTYTNWKGEHRIQILDIPFQPEANGNYVSAKTYETNNSPLLF
ncbi:GreA/GreB family elongation factor [uncultured Sunxiuqinia sp.]|uniref:GreA/GreB family elongation factor n=1 Tax=uncultured Sunxiuqinia sp. TaxID=1573825 RepID=UPI002632816F|nr:GreA/GreB family elongation factor [uncultured Sunxiuqinia sp.]